MDWMKHQLTTAIVEVFESHRRGLRASFGTSRPFDILYAAAVSSVANPMSSPSLKVLPVASIPVIAFFSKVII